jgi:hypothetical protein
MNRRIPVIFMLVVILTHVLGGPLVAQEQFTVKADGTSSNPRVRAMQEPSQEDLPTDVSTTLNDLKNYRDKTEDLARIVAKAFKDYKDDTLLKQAKDTERTTIQQRIQQYRKAAQLYGEARAAFGGWAEMVRDALATKGKKGAEKELNTNPAYRNRSRKAIAAADAFVVHAERMLYPESRGPKFQWPTFDQFSNLGKEIIKGIIAWKKYKEQKRKEYANEFYSRIEWKMTWDQIESAVSAPQPSPSGKP